MTTTRIISLKLANPNEAWRTLRTHHGFRSASCLKYSFSFGERVQRLWSLLTPLSLPSWIPAPMLPIDAKKNMGEKMYAEFLRVLDGSIMLRWPTPVSPVLDSHGGTMLQVSLPASDSPAILPRKWVECGKALVAELRANMDPQWTKDFFCKSVSGCEEKSRVSGRGLTRPSIENIHERYRT